MYGTLETPLPEEVRVELLGRDRKTLRPSSDSATDSFSSTPHIYTSSCTV